MAANPMAASPMRCRRPMGATIMRRRSPGQGQGYGSEEQQQYDEPVEQGDGAPQPY